MVKYASFRILEKRDDGSRLITIYTDGEEKQVVGKMREVICNWINEHKVDVLSINLIKNTSGERTEGVVWYKESV